MQAGGEGAESDVVVKIVRQKKGRRSSVSAFRGLRDLVEGKSFARQNRLDPSCQAWGAHVVLGMHGALSLAFPRLVSWESASHRQIPDAEPHRRVGLHARSD